MAAKEFVLTQRLLKWLKNRDVSVDCDRCGQPLKVGEKIVSRQAGCHNLSTKHYHVSCYEELFVEA